MSIIDKAAEVLESKIAKNTGRSYMGQLHSALTETGENLGLSNKVSKYAAGIGMAGAGIGAFNIANNTSENHPFVGGAMKVGIIAGAGYAALKGHGAKAISEVSGQLAFDFGKGAEATAATKAETIGGQGALDLNAAPNASGVSAAAGAVEKTSAPMGAAAGAGEKPVVEVPLPKPEPVKPAQPKPVKPGKPLPGLKSQAPSVPTAPVNAGTQSVGESIGTSVGPGSKLVSGGSASSLNGPLPQIKEPGEFQKAYNLHKQENEVKELAKIRSDGELANSKLVDEHGKKLMDYTDEELAVRRQERYAAKPPAAAPAQGNTLKGLLAQKRAEAAANHGSGVAAAGLEGLLSESRKVEAAQARGTGTP